MKMTTNSFMRLPQVKASTGLSKSSIYARIAEGTFPKQIPLGPRLVDNAGTLLDLITP